MTSQTHSQTALCGEVLNTLDQYRKELRELPTLSPEQESLLLESARFGEREARNQLIEHCLAPIASYAGYYYRTYSWQSARIEYEELLSVGNLALVECFDLALEKAEHPIGYLIATAKARIYQFICCHKSLISKPYQKGTSDIPVESFDVPINASKGEKTLADLLEAPPEERPSLESFEALYQAFTFLTPAQQKVIGHLYGFTEQGEHRFCETARKINVSETTLEDTRTRALERLRFLLLSKNACREVYTTEQVCERLGVKKKNFKDFIAPAYGVKSLLRGRGFYEKEAIEQIAQDRAARLAARCHTSSDGQELASAS